jgi:hypothetical protein
MPNVKVQRSNDKGLLPESPGANIKEFLVTILSKVKRPQTQCLSPKGEFWERSSALTLFAVKRTSEWSEILFRERRGVWAKVQQILTAVRRPQSAVFGM